MGLISLADASHLVGGFLTYRWLGRNGTSTQYRVTLFVYRDCTKDGTSDEVPFDDDIDLCVYSGDKRLYTTYKIKLIKPKKSSTRWEYKLSGSGFRLFGTRYLRNNY